jgi:hypothetical protein
MGAELGTIDAFAKRQKMATPSVTIRTGVSEEPGHELSLNAYTTSVTDHGQGVGAGSGDGQLSGRWKRQVRMSNKNVFQ